MIIKKLSEEVTHLRKTTTHEIDVNGKKIQIYEYDSDDIMDYAETTIDEDDKEKLTADEEEAIDEYMTEILDTKVGEFYNTNV